MTTTETHTRTCRRCHGSGRDPEGPAYNARQETVLERLGELGKQREPLVARRAYMRTEGRTQLDKIYSRARALIARGEELGVRAVDLQDALGVTHAAYYKIKNGETGG